MPFYRKPRNFTPLSVESEKKSIKNGLRHAIYTSRLDYYKGEWKNDKKEGKGRFLTIKGNLYEGDWYQGYRHGFGVLSYREAETGIFKLKYRGEWVRGKPEGIGWMYYENGDMYFGYFKRGFRHGYGKMWFKDGTLYVGYWNKDERDGLGMLVETSGNRYEGNWQGSARHGLGRYYHLHTGQLQEGCWDHGICVRSKMEDIIIRQFCDLPTPYPIPPQELYDARAILEGSELWLKQRLGDIDKKLQHCIDQMD